MELNPEIAKAFSLAGKVAVVTGAASGLGRESARLFAVAGAKAVVLADIDAAGLEATAGIVRQAGAEALVRPTNVGDRDAVEALADAAVSDCGGLDIWVNSAGILIWSGVTEVSQAEVEKVFAVNMLGTYWGCAAAGRVMTGRGGGAIVNISSTAGDSPVPRLSTYGMTKAAVNQLTRVSALEFGPSNVRVNAVVPGWIDTPMNSESYRDTGGAVDDGMREDVMAQMRALSPVGMTGEPVDIAMALLFLVSDASRFVTGQLFRISGGV